jgi:hypothetical protein
MTKKERAKIKAEIRQEIKNKKLQKMDGLGPYEVQKIRSALRLVWQRSHAWKIVTKRCTAPDGFKFCEKCHQPTPTLKIDHLKVCGDVMDGGYIARLFTPSKNLQGLCKPCHDFKTKGERSGKKPRAVRGKDWGF